MKYADLVREAAPRIYLSQYEEESVLIKQSMKDPDTSHIKWDVGYLLLNCPARGGLYQLYRIKEKLMDRQPYTNIRLEMLNGSWDGVKLRFDLEMECLWIENNYIKIAICATSGYYVDGRTICVLSAGASYFMGIHEEG